LYSICEALGSIPSTMKKKRKKKEGKKEMNKPYAHNPFLSFSFFLFNFYNSFIFVVLGLELRAYHL
jgi:hypothetical protein